MITYRIYAPHATIMAVVVGDNVVQAGPILSWAVGNSFIGLRRYVEQSGWTIEPLISDNPAVWLEMDGQAYEFAWEGSNLRRITEHRQDEDPKDITYEQLPDQLKLLI